MYRYRIYPPNPIGIGHDIGHHVGIYIANNDMWFTDTNILVAAKYIGLLLQAFTKKV